MNKLRLTALAIPLCFGACYEKLAGGAGAGNPPQAEVALSFKANTAGPLAKAAGPVVRNPDGSFSIKDSAGATLTLSAIDVAVRKIDFNLPEAATCADAPGLECVDREASLPGPFDVDLMTGNAVPAINSFKLPEGRYRKISLEFPSGDSHDSGGDDTVRNIRIGGRLGDSSHAGKAFTMALNLRDGLEFLDSAGIAVNAATTNTILLLVTVDKWFQGIDMGKCLADSTVGDSAGVAQLHGDAFCGGAGLRIRKNIEGSGEVNEAHSDKP